MKSRGMIKFMIVAFPLGLMVMGAGSLLLYEQRRVDKQTEHPMSQVLTQKGVIAHYKKLRDYMTPRGYETDEERLNLVRTGAFVDGTLSPMNTGMVVSSEIVLKKKGRVWKEYVLEYKGKSSRDPQEIRVNYVTGDDVELANALAFGEALPMVELEKTVKLIFHPEAGDSLFSPWAKEARLRGEGQSLSFDGVDWGYLVEETESLIIGLQVPE